MTRFRCPVCGNEWVQENDNDEPQGSPLLFYCSAGCDKYAFQHAGTASMEPSPGDDGLVR